MRVVGFKAAQINDQAIHPGKFVENLSSDIFGLRIALRCCHWRYARCNRFTGVRELCCQQKRWHFCINDQVQFVAMGQKRDSRNDRCTNRQRSQDRQPEYQPKPD